MGARALAILIALIERRGTVVSKTELQRIVWPDTIVEEGSLRVQMWTLRRSLGEDVGGPKFIMTSAGQGYSFVGDLSEAQMPAAEAASPGTWRPGNPDAIETSNLPYRGDPMVGREADMRAVAALLEVTQIVTIAGGGGVGKSRLALAVAAGLRDNPDGCWLLDLGALRNREQLAAGLGVLLSIGNAADLLELRIRLRNSRMLLVLDNCEHLLEAVAELADQLTAACPHLKLLTTSREPLRVSAETVFRLQPLPFPPVGYKSTVAESMIFPSVELFCLQARQVLGAFELTAESCSAVAEICRQLDGLPLAIELAVMRLRTTSVHQLAQRIDDRFRLLTIGKRTAAERHRSFQASLNWSFSLLSAVEMATMRQLSVFADSWSLDAAVAVAADPLAPESLPDIVWGLVDKSLLVPDHAGNEPRYRMLGSTRHFCSAMVSADERALLDERLQDYLVGLYDRAGREWQITGDIAWRAVYGPEFPNLRNAALRASGLPRAICVPLLAAADIVWVEAGCDAEIRHLIDRALDEMDDVGDVDDARIRSAGCRLSAHETPGAALALGRRAIKEFLLSGDQNRVLEARLGCAWAALAMNDDATAQAQCDALDATGHFTISKRAAEHLLLRATLKARRGETQMAKRSCGESLQMAERLEFHRVMDQARLLMAEIAHTEGEFETALAILSHILANHRHHPAAERIADRTGELSVRCQLARGAVAEAADIAIANLKRIATRPGRRCNPCDLAAIALAKERDRPEIALRVLGFAQRLIEDDTALETLERDHLRTLRSTLTKRMPTAMGLIAEGGISSVDDLIRAIEG